MPRVTVVIPAYNAAAFLAETLRSVESQTWADRELIVVDDGSADRTAEIAQRAGARVLQRNRGGPAAARNDGIAAGSGELIALLDADDLWLPRKLERQVAAMDAAPQAVLSATGVEQLGGGAALPRPVAGAVTPILVQENFVTTSSVMFRRATFERAGGFDPEPELVSVEDYDLWLRMSLAGPFSAVPEVLVRRRVHETNLSGDGLDLDLRTLRVLERFERAAPGTEHRDTLARRKASLHYRVGRGYLARGEGGPARAAFRRSRGLDPSRVGNCIALEALSLLPRPLLLTIGDLRRRRRRRVA